jgi:hypothetical protein
MRLLLALLLVALVLIQLAGARFRSSSSLKSLSVLRRCERTSILQCTAVIQPDASSKDAASVTPSSSNSAQLPSNAELLKFGVPTLAIGLLQPIMSLIDTVREAKLIYCLLLCRLTLLSYPSHLSSRLHLKECCRNGEDVHRDPPREFRAGNR